MFRKDSIQFNGIAIDPETILYLSISWSMLSCVKLHLKFIRVNKEFFPFTPKITVWTWGLFGTLRRILSIVAFFTPYLGLFDILHHWKAELIPFWIR